MPRERRRGAPPGGVEVTEANFEAEVLVRSNQVPVVVLLWSPRSEASVQLGDVLAALADADGGKWALATVNVDTAPRVAQVFGVQAVPTVVAVGGRPAAVELPGRAAARAAAPLGRLAAERHGGQARRAEPRTRPRRSTPSWPQRAHYLDAGDFDAALAAYQAILDAKPNHAEAKGAVRQIVFLKRATAQPPDAVARRRRRARRHRGGVRRRRRRDPAAGRRDGAFDRLIALVKRTAGDERTTVRTRLIELFDLFDPADPEVIAGRRNLANALY